MPNLKPIRPECSPKLKLTELVEQEDGARWFVFEDPSDYRRFTILTSAGRERVRSAGGGVLKNLIDDYRSAELNESNTMEGPKTPTRIFLGKGQEAKVFSMGEYAVRETQGTKGLYVALGELQRMDAINGVIEGGLPRWLNLPSHYALHVDPKRSMTYTLMDRINGGLTVEDVIEYPYIAEDRKVVVEKELGAYTADAQIRVPHLYERAQVALDETIRQAGKRPEHYLTDWVPRNVIVEHLDTPIAGESYCLNVIDQYRA